MENKTANKILLAIDFQETSMLALEYAVFFARQTGAEIELVHIIETSGLLTKVLDKNDRARLKREAETVFEGVISKIPEEIPVKFYVKEGKAYNVIVNLANEIKPKFILMGKNEENTLTKKIVGSNTLHVIENSIYPVVSIRGRKVLDEQQTLKEILVPMDLTKQVCEQITVAIEYAKYFNARLNVISVQTSKRVSEEIDILKKINKVNQIIEQEGLKCTTKIIEESKVPVPQVITNYSKENKVGMIIIMTQQEFNIMDYFVGTNAKAIIDKAEAPVLSINPWRNPEDSVFNNFVDPLGIYSSKK